MPKILRWTGYALGALLAVVLLAAAALWILSAHKLSARVSPKPERLVRPTPAQFADAPRQLQILGCVSCHGEGLRGKLMFNQPNIAQVYAPNLTLIAAQATDQQLARAIRQGIGHDGRSLYVMPSAEYSHLRDQEVAALIAAIRKLPRGGSETPAVKLGPLARIGVLNGKFRSQPELVAEYAANKPPDLGPQFALGRHIAMTNCTECHGPTFAGGEPQPGLQAPDLSIAGAYDLAAFTRLMRTGVPPDGRKLRLMDEVSRNDFRHLKDEELTALHAYLVERAQRAP